MSITSFIDPLALSLVAGASISTAWVQNGSATAKRAVKAACTILWSNPKNRADDGHRAVLRIEHVVESRGVNCADRVKTGGRFVTDAAEMMANQRTATGFQQAVQRLAAEQRNQASANVRFWENMADSAPAMGMLGTVIGLIVLFGQVDDAAAIGRAMAIALLTTLYGLAIANLVAGPIAQRLARIYGEELGWQEDVANRLIDIGRREYPDITRHPPAPAGHDDAEEGKLLPKPLIVTEI